MATTGGRSGFWRGQYITTFMVWFMVLAYGAIYGVSVLNANNIQYGRALRGFLGLPSGQHGWRSRTATWTTGPADGIADNRQRQHGTWHGHGQHNGLYEQPFNMNMYVVATYSGYVDMAPSAWTS